MKLYFKYIFLTTFFALGLVACQDQLDLQPGQGLDENEALNTDKRVKAVLIGAYDALGDNAGNLFGGNTLRNSELLGGDDEISWVGTFEGPDEIFNKRMIAENSDAQTVWIAAYQAINITNNVLGALNFVNEDDRGTVEGEAKFIRGLTYFELIRFYAKPYEAGQANTQPGVPLVLTPTRGIDEKNNVSRNTVQEVYAQVIKDLTEAEALLPEENEWRASKWAAAAILSRVYLQQGDYAKARDAANRVIESGLFALLPDYEDVFNRDQNSSEDIFAIQLTTQDGVNNMNTFFSTPQFGGRDGDIEINQEHLDLYDPEDERLALFYEDNGGVIYSGKWTNLFGNVGIVRLAEMYLTRAEANFRLGTSVGATPVEDYNVVHTRAGLPAATSVTLEEILLERRRELAHEGAKIHDIKRTKASVGDLPYNSDKLVFPIPAREISANPNLTQNPGY
ncbi:MAG: RagB/SusD family nutrient uptake outer membrane protein [Saprospiraceae bacterium]